MYSGRSATPTVHRMPSNADPSPRGAGQSALPHDRRVQRASPGQTWAPPAGNSPVYGPGWEIPLVVAQGVAGKPGLFLPGRTVYFCPFQPGVQQDDALRLRQGLGERAGGQESGPAGPRRLLPGKYPLVSFPGSLIVRSCPEAVNWMLFPACCGGCTNSKS